MLILICKFIVSLGIGIVAISTLAALAFIVKEAYLHVRGAAIIFTAITLTALLGYVIVILTGGFGF
jgi:hypothetical protein